MKFQRMFVCLVVLGVIALQGAFAANPLYKGMSWVVGQWAQYEMKSSDMTMTVKYSVTGTEVIDGKTYYWFEMASEMPQGKSIMKMLIIPGQSDPKQIIMKTAGQPAMDMTDMMKNAKRQQNKPPVHSDDEINKGLIGIETVKVPAGSFVATHSKINMNKGEQTGEVWVSALVPLTGIVKSSGKGQSDFTLTLIKYGNSGAKTEITEKPQKFDMGNMMRNMRPPKDTNE